MSDIIMFSDQVLYQNILGAYAPQTMSVVAHNALRIMRTRYLGGGGRLYYVNGKF